MCKDLKDVAFFRMIGIEAEKTEAYHTRGRAKNVLRSIACQFMEMLKILKSCFLTTNKNKTARIRAKF